VIYFSKNHIKIEDCYYFKNKRECTGTEYNLTNDTLLVQQKEKWIFEQLGINKYKVKKIGKTHFEIGYATSLIPFIKHGDFFGISLNSDTLWKENFYNNSSKSFDLHKIQIKNKTFSIGKLDSLPLINGTDTIPKIKLEFVDLRPNGHFYKFDSIQVDFIVTDQGVIKNIDVFAPLFSSYLKEILIKLSLLSPLSPPIRNHKKVFCTYYIHAYRVWE
jgi:hypothetical protein